MSILADLEIVATGCAVVVGALALLWGLMALVGRLVALCSRRPAAATAGAEFAVVALCIPAHHLVAIAAAVEATLGGGYRISGISAPAHRIPAWAASGRHPRPDRRPADGGLPNKRTDGS